MWNYIKFNSILRVKSPALWWRGGGSPAPSPVYQTPPSHATRHKIVTKLQLLQSCNVLFIIYCNLLQHLTIFKSNDEGTV